MAKLSDFGEAEEPKKVSWYVLRKYRPKRWVKTKVEGWAQTVWVKDGVLAWAVTVKRKLKKELKEALLERCQQVYQDINGKTENEGFGADQSVHYNPTWLALNYPELVGAEHSYDKFTPAENWWTKQQERELK